MKRSSLIVRPLATLEFAWFYLREVVASNLRVAYDVLTPRHLMKPAILHIPIAGLTDRQRLALANLLTMTPGTLTIDLAEDGSELLFHSMYVEDPEKEVRHLVTHYVERIRRVF